MEEQLSSVVLRDYQLDAIEKMHNGCILLGGVGSGKSITALEYGRRTGKPIYVITTSKKRDSGEWAEDSRKIGIPIESIDSWNNIKKYTAVEDCFFIFDEQKVTGHGAWAKTFIKLAKTNQWILLSATPGDCWDDYSAVFIANNFVRNRSVWLRDFCVLRSHTSYSQIIGYRMEDVLEKMRDRILVQMEYRSPNKRIHHKVLADANTEMEYGIIRYRKLPDGRPFKSLSSVLPYIRMYAYDPESKKSRIKTIMENHRKAIIFYNFRKERMEIEAAAHEMGIPFSEYNGLHHDPIPDTDRWIYVVQYLSGSEAWNCTNCNCMIFYSLNYSYMCMEQACGRIDRLNSEYKELHYYHIYTPLAIDKNIRNALRRKRDFEDRDYTLVLNEAGEVEDDAW